MTALSSHDLNVSTRVIFRVPENDVEAPLMRQYDGLTGVIHSFSFHKETALVILDDGRKVRTVSTILLEPFED